MTTGTGTLQIEVDSLIDTFGKAAVQSAVNASKVVATPVAQPARKLPEYHGINLGDINDVDLRPIPPPSPSWPRSKPTVTAAGPRPRTRPWPAVYSTIYVPQPSAG